MIRFNCPTCANEIQVQDVAAGRTGKCQKCGSTIRVPAVEIAITANLQAQPVSSTQSPNNRPRFNSTLAAVLALLVGLVAGVSGSQVFQLWKPMGLATELKKDTTRSHRTDDEYDALVAQVHELEAEKKVHASQLNELKKQNQAFRTKINVTADGLDGVSDGLKDVSKNLSTIGELVKKRSSTSPAPVSTPSSSRLGAIK